MKKLQTPTKAALDRSIKELMKSEGCNYIEAAQGLQGAYAKMKNEATAELCEAAIGLLHDLKMEHLGLND